MNEAETRAEHIDPALRAAGWGVAEGSKILREYSITPGRIEGNGRHGKPLSADYVLVYRNHKLLVMAHSPRHYAALGRLAAGAGAQGRRPAAALLDAYLATLLEGLRLAATAAKHTNVLQHAAGYFKRLLTAEEKAELGETIESFRRGLLPLIVPVTLLARYTRVYGEPWLARQHYLHLHPRELMLRNHG